MARLLMSALAAAGYDAYLASRLRQRATSSSEPELQRVSDAATLEMARLTAASRPDLWFTYHNYYRCPDLLGPMASKAFDVPYVIAEASYARKRDGDEWSMWQAAAMRAVSQANCVFCLTEADREGLNAWEGRLPMLVDLPPFVDAPALQSSTAAHRGSIALITVAMMRPGVKIDSYRFLAQALEAMTETRWHLTIVGDGPARAEVEGFFAPLVPRVTFVGELPRDSAAAMMTDSDVFCWPGFGEAYGMVYLEAQACGVPVVALESGGVSSAMRPGETGLLIADRTPQAYAAGIDRLVADRLLRAQMSRAAVRFARGERSVQNAAARLSTALHRVVDDFARAHG